MQYLRDKYKEETGYDYPDENEPDEYYVEWLERLVANTEDVKKDVSSFRYKLIGMYCKEDVSGERKHVVEDILVEFNNHFEVDF